MPGVAYPMIIDAGDSGAMVLFGDQLDMAINNAVHVFDARLRQQQFGWLSETVPAIHGLLVRYDPLRISAAHLHEQLENLLATENWLQAPPNRQRKIWRLPAHYGEQSGPDIENVATMLALSVQQVIAEHSQTRMRVLMLGFAPGCAYLGALPAHWDLPRLDQVKPEVPLGSLSVAVRQTVFFANAMPTGWHTIARTPFRAFTSKKAPYFHISAGDEISFLPVDYQQFQQLQKHADAGKTIVSPQSP